METTTDKTSSRVTERLQNIIETKPNTLKSAVAQEALEYSDAAAFFHDILQHGCKSGIVSSLIYYADTHKFFEKYYDAIEQIRDEVEANLGEALSINGDLKNCLAWFAFEETAYQLALELRLEI